MWPLLIAATCFFAIGYRHWLDWRGRNVPARPVLVFFEGNIAAGKSVLMRRIEPYLRRLGFNVAVVLEPVDVWTNVNGTHYNALDEYYRAPKRWAALFQMVVSVSRLERIRAALRALDRQVDGPVVVLCERSAYTETTIFARRHLRADNMTPSEFAVYSYVTATITDTLGDVCDELATVYVRSSRDRCVERVARRRRVEEIGAVDAQLIDDLHRAHEHAFARRTTTPRGKPCLEFDVERWQGLDSDDALAERAADEIGAFLSSLLVSI